MVVDSPTANLRAKSVKRAGASPLTRTASVRLKATPWRVSCLRPDETEIADAISIVRENHVLMLSLGSLNYALEEYGRCECG